MITVGKKAPDFSLPTNQGTTIRLRDLRGKKIVLYFYPKDWTPGCTREACAFEENQTALKKRGVVVLGISTDSVSSHERFAGKYHLSFPLLSDEKKEVVKSYGVWKKKNLYGRISMGTVRTTVIIDEHGTVQTIFPRVKVDGHVGEVLAALDKGEEQK